MPKETYTIPQWEKLSANTAKFIFEQAEKNLTEHLETGKHITTRASTIIGFALPVSGAIIGYIFNEIIKNTSSGFHFWIPVIVLIPILAVLWVSIDAYWIYKRSPLGNEPRNFVNEEKILSNLQEVAFIVKRIESVQRQIILNDGRNNIRMKQLRIIEWIVVGTLAVLLVPCII